MACEMLSRDKDEDTNVNYIVTVCLRLSLRLQVPHLSPHEKTIPQKGKRGLRMLGSLFPGCADSKQ